MTSKFLDTVLGFDAATCAAMGAGLLLAAAPLAPLLGMPAPFLAAAGAALLGFAVILGWAALGRPAPSALVAMIVAGNIAWAAASLLLVAEGVFPLTAFGALFVTAQALAVLAIAAAEYAGLRRFRRLAH